jgi:hypothetical protein
MKLAGCYSHEEGETVVYGRGLGDAYAEARDVILATRFYILPTGGGNRLRMTRGYILSELGIRGWELLTRVTPPSGCEAFDRGKYHLDAIKRGKSRNTIGLICHFGSSEFGLRQLMLVSGAERRGVVDCGVIAVMAREATPYLTGRPSSYEQLRALLHAFGNSEFHGVPMVLWGLTPDPTFTGQVGRSVRVKAKDV